MYTQPTLIPSRHWYPSPTWTGERYQFERLGYFCADLTSTPGTLVFNRVVTLKDTWEEAKQTASPGSVAAADGGAGDSRAMAKAPRYQATYLAI